MVHRQNKSHKDGTTDRIRALLKEQEGATASEACRMLGIDRKSFHALVRRLRLKGEVYVSEYVESDTAVRTTKVAVYVLGKGEDAPRPKAQRRIDVKRRYDQRVRGLNRTNSVFNLALSRHKYTFGAKI